MSTALRHQPRLSAEAARAAFAAFTGDLGKVSFLGLVVLGVAWFTRRGKFPVALASVVGLALLLVELWPVSRAVMQPTIGDPVAHDADAGRDDVVEFLEKAAPAGDARVFCFEQELFTSNRMAGFGISTLGGQHSAKTKLFQDLMDSSALFQRSWLALLNCRYWVFSRPITANDLPADGLALPRTTLPGAWSVVPDTGRSVLDAVSAVQQNPATFTWLASDPGIPSGPAESAGTTRVTRYRLHEVDVDVEAHRPAVLRLADLWYPDWKVAVDGKPARLLRADHALRAVAVPAGHHTVTFRFASTSFRVGLWMSIASAFVSLLLLAAGVWLERRRSAVVPAPQPQGAPA